MHSYSDEEKNENEIYENSKFQDEEIFEYETLEELDESSQEGESKKELFSETSATEGGNDAVSFLTGILKKPSSDNSNKVMEIKKIKSKTIIDSGFDDPNRKHACNVCHKKFQKRSNLIDHLRLHANVKVFSCEYCEKSFVQAGNFKAHLRTHTKGNVHNFL